jgi:uncharacterized protein
LQARQHFGIVETVVPARAMQSQTDSVKNSSTAAILDALVLGLLIACFGCKAISNRYPANGQPTAAVQRCTEDAMAGNPRAMVALARRFQTGNGVRRDLVEAYKWYTIAVEYGYKSAGSDRAALLVQMEVDDIMCANELAEEFLAQHPSPLPRRTQMSCTTTNVIGAFNVPGSPFCAYDKRIVLSVQKQWYSLIYQRNVYWSRGTVTLHFLLNQDGSVRDLEVREDTAGRTLASVCEEAIRKAAPFRPLPDDLWELVGEEPREVNFTFYY